VSVSMFQGWPSVVVPFQTVTQACSHPASAPRVRFRPPIRIPQATSAGQSYSLGGKWKVGLCPTPATEVACAMLVNCSALSSRAPTLNTVTGLYFVYDAATSVILPAYLSPKRFIVQFCFFRSRISLVSLLKVLQVYLRRPRHYQFDPTTKAIKRNIT
jgi:hypothetical protein